MKREWPLPKMKNQIGYILTLTRRPDFVAVLGVLSKTEIEEYIARTQKIRKARGAKNHSVHGSSTPSPPTHISQTTGIRRDPRGPESRSAKHRMLHSDGKNKGRSKDNSAAGVGGAARRLLEVLSEAAEGL